MKRYTVQQFNELVKLVDQAGYTALPGYDAMYVALGDLIPTGEIQTSAGVGALIDALRRKLCLPPAPPIATSPTMPVCRDCGVPGWTDSRGLGVSCGCAAE